MAAEADYVVVMVDGREVNQVHNGRSRGDSAAVVGH
jgi:hypothetical protein